MNDKVESSEMASKTAVVHEVYCPVDEVMDLEPSHWFCHSCKAHFGMPVYEVTDRRQVWVCPLCKEPEIEDNGI